MSAVISGAAYEAEPTRVNIEFFEMPDGIGERWCAHMAVARSLHDEGSYVVGLLVMFLREFLDPLADRSE